MDNGVVLLGDSHLARIGHNLETLVARARNAAVGGASTRDLRRQATGAEVGSADTVVLSVGTNDAAPWKSVPLPEFVGNLEGFLQATEVRSWVYVTPPGVVEARLGRSADRTNAVMDRYRTAALTLCEEVGAHVVPADRLVAPLGPSAFTADGVHLSANGYRLLVPAIVDAVR